MEITKADWKLFREKLPGWQEHYMEKLANEYIKLLSSPGPASEHFWELEKRIKEEEGHYINLPKKYAFKDQREKEIMLGRNFRRVNDEVKSMIEDLLGKQKSD